MKILLHTCCAPCSIYPVDRLRDQSFDVTGYFYRNNIHPYSECMRREETLVDYAKRIDLPVIYPDDYDLEGFLRQMMYREDHRCEICYFSRLSAAAHIAKHGRFDCFSTTLLYSRFQKHEKIRSIGESVGQSVGVPFYYADFREGWKTGVETSKQLGMYRQQYCGCVYSEKERYFRPSRKITQPA